MKEIYAVHQASTLCGENETGIYASNADAVRRFEELVKEYKSRGDDIHILVDDEFEFFADNESQGIYNRILIETITIQ